MRLTLKNLLRACRIDLRKHLSKRDKWIKEWPGQVSTASGAVCWWAASGCVCAVIQ